MTRPPSSRPGPPTAMTEDPEIADLVRQVASGWSMPPQPRGAPRWHDRAGRHRTGRWERLVAASGIAAAAVVFVAVGAALLGGGPARDAGPSPESSGAAVAPVTPSATSGPSAPGSPGRGSPTTGPTATPAPAATPLPAYVAPAGPVSGLSIGAIALDGWRVVDMSTGSASDAIALPDGSGSRLFALADGTYLCACATYEGPDSRSLRVVIRRYDALGRPGDELAVVGYESGHVRVPSDGAPPAAVQPSISPDGRTVAVGWTTWDGAFWRSGVDVIDVTPGRPSSGYAMASIELPRVSGSLDASVGLSARWAAYAGSGKALSAWAPAAWISPDGRTLVARRSLVIEGTVVRTDWFTGPVPPQPAPPAAVPFGGTTDPTRAPCAMGDVGDAGWTAADVFSIVCSSETSSGVLRYDATGRDLGAVDLAPETGGGSWPAIEGSTVADVPRGTLYLWEPFARRLVAVDTVAGRVARSTTIDAGADGGSGPIETLAGLVRRALAVVVPRASAKVYLSPALALARDGATLYLLGTAATSFESGGSGSLGVIVVGADDLAVRARWTPTTDLRSIAVSADGRYVLAAGAAGVDASGAEVPWEASITAWDAATGRVRAVAGRLGTTWLELVAPLLGE
jgi:hypothetical protein